jgi:hypothetical protein
MDACVSLRAKALRQHMPPYPSWANSWLIKIPVFLELLLLLLKWRDFIQHWNSCEFYHRKKFWVCSHWWATLIAHGLITKKPQFCLQDKVYKIYVLWDKILWYISNEQNYKSINTHICRCNNSFWLVELVFIFMCGLWDWSCSSPF